jgi:hypothetical protein
MSITKAATAFCTLDEQEVKKQLHLNRHQGQIFNSFLSTYIQVMFPVNME